MDLLIDVNVEISLSISKISIVYIINNYTVLISEID